MRDAPNAQWPTQAAAGRTRRGNCHGERVCEDIRSYLDAPLFAETYSGELRAEIERVMAAMESLRERLDRPPLNERDDVQQ